MQDEVEVAFCDLCGTSVPVVDLASGGAVRHQGKVVGACCLRELRGQSAAAATPAVAPIARSAGEARVLPATIALLAALAATTIFLDHRITSTDAKLRDQLARVTEAQTSDSQVLAGLAVAMDAVPRRADVDGVSSSMQELLAAETKARVEVQQRLESIGQELLSVQREQRAQAGQVVDYRPLIEDLRQRQVRLVDLVTTLRAVAPAGEAAAAPKVESSSPEAPAAPSLPPALAEQVKKLQATDPAVRFEAVDELLRAKDVAVLPRLLPMAQDADAFVRRLTVEGLREWKRVDVVDTLLAALADADEYVRDTAWRSLKEVTGQKFAFESGGSKDARARAVAKWQEWWEKNKATFGS